MLYCLCICILINTLNNTLLTSSIRYKYNTTRPTFLYYKYSNASPYSLHIYSINEDQDNLNIHSNEEDDEVKLQLDKDEDSEIDIEAINRQWFSDTENVELSKEDEANLQKILDKHIELHRHEYECSETVNNSEVVKRKPPKKFDLNESDDEFEVENYNGSFPDQEEVVKYLDPLNLRNIVKKEEYTKSMVGRTYNLFNLPEGDYKTQCIDEARRFLYHLPLNDWNQNERLVLNEYVKRQKLKEEQEVDIELKDYILPNDLLNAAPSSPAGLVNECNFVPASFNQSVHKMMEYTHYDLLKDLTDSRKEWLFKEPPNNLEEPLFVRLNEDNRIENEVQNFSNYLKLTPSFDSLSIYTAWPNSTLDSDISKGVFTEIEDVYMFNIEDESLKSHFVDNIPFDGNYRSAIILLESELGGANDHRVRDLADELSCATKFPIFIPQINSSPEHSFKALDRLIKNIQILYNIERIALVSMGKSSKILLDYCFERLNGKEFLNEPRGVLTLFEITNRVSFPLSVNIFDYNSYHQALEEKREIERARQLNPVKFLKSILQCLVFLDGRNIDVDKALSLGTPLLNVISGKDNKEDWSGKLQDVFNEWKDLHELGYESSYEPGKEMDSFNILIPKGKLLSTYTKDIKQNNEGSKSTGFRTAMFKGKDKPVYLLKKDADVNEMRVSTQNNSGIQ